MIKRDFNIEVLLTVTTGRFLCKDIDSLYGILNFCTGDNLFTHVLERAAAFAKPKLESLFPLLVDIELPVFKDEHSSEERSRILADWIHCIHKQYGSIRSFEGPFPGWFAKDPVKELIDMRNQQE